ncbi:MAG: integration host factor subunit beta [Alistipes sp.]|nr:integration host factor subunit beta [Alistipes sp.]
MQRAELAAAAAKKAGQTRQNAEAVILAALEVITETLASGDGVYLRGFGSFVTMERRGKVGRNISKGTAVDIPPHTAVKFKPADALKKAVKEGK